MPEPTTSQDREHFSNIVGARADEYFPFAKYAPQEQRVRHQLDGKVIIRFSLWWMAIAFVTMLVGMVLSRVSYGTEEMGQAVHQVGLWSELFGLALLLLGLRRRGPK